MTKKIEMTPDEFNKVGDMFYELGNLYGGIAAGEMMLQASYSRTIHECTEFAYCLRSRHPFRVCIIADIDRANKLAHELYEIIDRIKSRAAQIYSTRQGSQAAHDMLEQMSGEYEYKGGSK